METVMAGPRDTQALVHQARHGDRKAFDELAAQARGRLIGEINRMLGQRLREKVDPEDVLQEVVLRAFESIGRFEGEDADAFQRWLEGIARNVVRNLARRKGWKNEFEITRDPPSPVSSPSRHQRREERFERLSKCVESLSPDYRTVIRLVRIDGLKIREVAERMNRSESAVKNLLLRAMKELRNTFSDTDSFSLPDRRLASEGESDAV